MRAVTRLMCGVLLASSALVAVGAVGVGVATEAGAQGLSCSTTYNSPGGGSFLSNSGWTNGAPGPSSDVCIASGTIVLDQDPGSSNYTGFSINSLSISQGASLVLGDYGGGLEDLNLDVAADVDNSGTIELYGGYNGYTSLIVGGSMTNESTGTVDSANGAPNWATLGERSFLQASTFTNLGTLSVESPSGFTLGAAAAGTESTLAAGGGTYTNEGTILVQPSSAVISGTTDNYNGILTLDTGDLVNEGSFSNVENESASNLQDAGYVALDGELDVEGGELCGTPAYVGPGTLNFGSTAAVDASCSGVTPVDTVLVEQYNANNVTEMLSGTIPPEYTVDYDTADSGNGSTLTAVAGTTNDGTLVLHGGYNGINQFNSSGTFTNNGTVDVPNDGGDPVTANVSDFENAGTLSVERALDSNGLSLLGSLTNQSTATVSVTGTLTLGNSSTATSVNQDGQVTVSGSGVINGDGVLDVEGGAVCGPSATSVNQTGTIEFASGVTAGSPCATGDTDTISTTLNSSDTLEGTVPAGYTISVGIGDNGQNTVLTADAGAVNDGTVELHGSYNGTNQFDSSGTFTNNGTFDVPNDTGNPVTIAVTSFDNTGTFSVEKTLGSGATFSGALTNGSSGAIGASGTLNLGNSTTNATVTQDGQVTVSGIGVINGDGVLDVEGGTLCGPSTTSINQTGTIEFASTVGAGGACTAGQLRDTITEPVNATDTLEGTVPAGYTISVGIGDNGQNTVLDAAIGAVNDGTIELHGSYNGTNQFDSSGTFTNAGTFDVPADSGNPVTIAVLSFVNTGTVSVEKVINNNGADFTGPASSRAGLKNTGTISSSGVLEITTPASGKMNVTQKGTIAAGGSGTIAVTGKLKIKGGSLCGPSAASITVNGTIAFGSALSSGQACASGLLSDQITEPVNDSDTVTGTVAKGYTISVGLPGQGSNATLTLPAAGTNDGTIVLNGSYNGTNKIVDTGTLTNAGTITLPDDSQAVELEIPSLVNSGALTVDYHATDTGSISGSNELTLGPSGQFTVEGSFAAAKSGTLSFDGTGATSFPTMSVGSGSSVAGTLALILPSFSASSGQTADLLSASGLTSSFKKLVETVTGTSSPVSATTYSQNTAASGVSVTTTGTATLTAASSVAPRSSLSFSGSAFPDLASITGTLTENGATVGSTSTTASGSGGFSGSIEVPGKTAAGSATLTVTATVSGQTLTVTVPVTVS